MLTTCQWRRCFAATAARPQVCKLHHWDFGPTKRLGPDTIKSLVTTVSDYNKWDHLSIVLVSLKGWSDTILSFHVLSHDHCTSSYYSFVWSNWQSMPWHFDRSHWNASNANTWIREVQKLAVDVVWIKRFNWFHPANISQPVTIVQYILCILCSVMQRYAHSLCECSYVKIARILSRLLVFSLRLAICVTAARHFITLHAIITSACRSLPPRCLECCLCKELLEHREALLQCLEMREGLQVRIPVRSTEWDSLVDGGCPWVNNLGHNGWQVVA